MMDRAEKVVEGTPRKGGGGQESVPEQDNPNPGKPQDERVDPPQNISGTYLTCSFEVKPDPKTEEALLGCRIDDKDGKRLPGTSLAPSFIYDFKLIEALDNVKITPRILDGDNRYDALFLLQGKLDSELARKVARIVINARFKGVNAQSDFVIDGILANILKNSSALPELRSFDYPAAISRIIQDAQAGVATPLALDLLPSDPLAKGAQLYAQYCQSCHGLKGADPKVNIRNASKESITASLETTAAMESLRGLFNADDIGAIAAYLK